MFTLFPALPSELRLMIWDFAIPPGDVAYRPDRLWGVIIKWLNQPDSIRVQLSCVEARAVWLARHKNLDIPPDPELSPYLRVTIQGPMGSRRIVERVKPIPPKASSARARK